MLSAKNLIVSLLVFFVVMFAMQNLFTGKNDHIRYSDFMVLLEQSQVQEITLQGRKVFFSLDESRQLTTVIPGEQKDFVRKVHEKVARIRVKSPDEGNFLLALLAQWLPILLIIGIWVFAFRSFQGGSKLMTSNRFKIRGIEEGDPKYTFKDVAGIDEAIDEVREIVEYMKEPGKFQKLGGKIPTGILLCGQPGTGKTLLAKAIAGEAGIGFFSITGSDFVEMFVGVGAGRVRELFNHARASAPCIIFIDEIDAVGRNRGSGLGGGNDEREQTLNQMLVEMDGFSGKEGIIVIAATNRPDVLDPALTRPGRFDRTVMVPPPDAKGREKILQIHSKDVKLEENVKLETIAKSMPSATGADLENLVNEAALLAARKKKETVGKLEFEEARDKITMGTERKTLSMSERELETTAYHEAGHAIVAALLDECDPLHKVTVIPRGRALGVTMLLPKEEKFALAKSKIAAVLQMMMGGRAAEEIVYDHFTTGASSDLERATVLAHDMVCRWGMSEKIGPVYLSENRQEVFIGRDMMKKKLVSQTTSKLVDDEVKAIVNTSYKQALAILRKNKKSLEEVTEQLLAKETIEGCVVTNILKENGALT